jgi:hypothetical protein
MNSPLPWRRRSLVLAVGGLLVMASAVTVARAANVAPTESIREDAAVNAAESAPAAGLPGIAENESARRSTIVAPVSESARSAITSPDMCPAGTLPLLEIARYPQANTHGAPTPELAAKSVGALGVLTIRPMGRLADAPVWVVAGEQTFVATILPDGTWFISPARVKSCQEPSRPSGTPPSSGAGTRG